ncbi:cyclase family protein [Myroides sp. LJL119]
MKTTISYQGENYCIDLSKPLDLSIELKSSQDNPIAWYLDIPLIEPVKVGDWVAKVSLGGSSTNFNNITFNPHAHTTHTECVGHISSEFYSVNKALTEFFFLAQLISVTPELLSNGDRIITLDQIKREFQNKGQKAFVIRTLPNDNRKKSFNYSHTNPPYLDPLAADFLKQQGIEHLLIDLPSVDKEKDQGKLAAHKAFWNVEDINNLDDRVRYHCTITEFIFVENTILDGLYFLNLQLGAICNDASISRPVFFKIQE